MLVAVVSLVFAGIFSGVASGASPATLAPPPPGGGGSLGTQVCAGTSPFVFLEFVIDDGAETEGACFDGAGPWHETSTEENGYVIAIDNQISHRLWLSGYSDNEYYNPYNYCYEQGFDFAVGPGQYGGDGEVFLFNQSITTGSSAPCSVSGSIGTTEKGISPELAPGCMPSETSDDKGAHLFMGFVDEGYWSWKCYPDASANYGSVSGGALQVFANGTGHQAFVTLNGADACVDSNHLISPVASAFQNYDPNIFVTNYAANC